MWRQHEWHTECFQVFVLRQMVSRPANPQSSRALTANVPLFAGEEPPKALLELDPRKVIGLTANAYRMESVREARVASWGMDPGDHYADRRAIMHELRETNAIMARYGWRTVDVSHKAVEEVAREVRVLLNLGDNEGW